MNDFYENEQDEFNDEALRRLEEDAQKKKDRVLPSSQPLLQTLLMEVIEAEDAVLQDFAHHIVGALSDHFATTGAKGGAFFREREVEGKSVRAKHDQNLRAHLINGVLPALRIARLLAAWGSRTLRMWDETAERLFIAGYMLHDFTKIPEVKVYLKESGFAETEAPSPRMIPFLEQIFLDWGSKLGLDAFLKPLGGMGAVVQEIMFIACNTQVLWGTARPPGLFPKMRTRPEVYLAATTVSRLADLVAYAARTPRQMVAHETITKKVFGELAVSLHSQTERVGRLVYHHVAENRGLLLNFIHDGALRALTVPNQRVPLLYAPSGVVYLERAGAPPMPDPADLVAQIVADIRLKAGEELINKGKGAKRGNTGLQVDTSYDDYFDLREFVGKSVKLTQQFITNNKSEDRLQPIRGVVEASKMPPALKDAKDARLDQLAEWAGLLYVQIRDRLKGWDFLGWLMKMWALEDIQGTLALLQNHSALKGGINYWAFWAAGHYLKRHPGLSPEAVIERMEHWSEELAATLPSELPATAQANEETWSELSDYIGRVLTIGGTKTPSASLATESSRYINAKGKRGGAVCTICGAEYSTRKAAETAVAFQPGVYTARIKLGGSDNKRNVCSICALEQLLRQLFVENLDSGGKVEGQRVRYLSFYPTYFFTPETLKLVRRAYNAFKDIRLSDKDFRPVLVAALDDPQLWQRLAPFLLRKRDEQPSKRMVRYGESAEATFLMLGLRGFKDPSDTESWIIPAFLSLILPICLDLKVVASESSVPLMLESDELQETTWFEGAHASIRDLTTYRWQDEQNRAYEDATGRIMVDALLPMLKRFTAAALIHLDSEYAPPDEHWSRFAPIAHALMESPLYVFHYLKKQERDDRPMTPAQVRRYVRYAEEIFNDQGDVLMSYAKQLVELYRGFYRAKNIKNANSILRPLSVISDALLTADMRLFSDAESLIEVAYGELFKFMDRVGKGLADGRFPKGVSAPERDAAMRAFCTLFVTEVFVGVFNKDVAALRGKQLNLLKNACEVLYRDAQNQEWAERGPDEEETDEIEDADEPANRD